MASLDNPFYAYRVAGSGDADWTIVEVTDGSFPESFTGASDTEYEVKTKIWSESAFATTGSGSFDSDYQAVLDYATAQGYTLPSPAQQTLQNQLVIDLKNAGIWAKLDTFAVFATNGSANFALIDWVNLNQYTAFNAPTFTINQGYTGDGISAYVGSTFDASTLPLPRRASSSFGVRASVSAVYIAGMRGVRRSNVSGANTTNTGVFNSSSITTSGTYSGATGCITNVRSGSSLEVFNDAASVMTGTGLTNDSATLIEPLRVIDGIVFSTAQINAVWFCEELTSLEVADLHNAINAYYTAL